MAEFPYMIWFPRDFHADTTHLTPMAELAYRRILEFLWLRGGTLPLDHELLSRLGRSASGRSWERVWVQLEAFFVIDTERNVISQRRITSDLEVAEERAERFAQRGKKGADGKHRKNNGHRLHEGGTKHPSSSAHLQPTTILPPNPPTGGSINGSGAKPPTLDAAGEIPTILDDGRVWVDGASADGAAWDAHLRAKRGRPMPRDNRGGWYMPTARPPGAGADPSGRAVGPSQKSAAGDPSEARETASGNSHK